VNCWGSTIYRELKRQYNTPFVGLYFFAPCYIQLLKKLPHYMDADLTFAANSKYPFANQLRQLRSNYYPIGILGGDVEIHFLHFNNHEQAREKWHVRRKRMNMDNLFFQFSDEYLCEDRHLQEFDCLDFPNKVIFTAKPHPDLKSAVWLSEYADQPHIQNPFTERFVYRRHFDVADWLNGGSGKPTALYRIVNRLLEAPV
jgi:uncharacterized protein (DUF1919 family)